MKKWFSILFLTALTGLVITGCKKDETKVIYQGGKAPVITSSVTNSLVLLAPDSLKDAITLSWSDPEYSLSTGRTTLDITYVVEIDSSGKDFSKGQTISLVDIFQKKFTVKEFNQLLIKMGFKGGQTYGIDMRVTSSSYWAPSRFMSNKIKLLVTPYSVKPTPKIPVPANLYIVGDATVGGWTNPVPTPAQQLTLIDEFTYGGIVELTAGKFYLLLPNNGLWDHKYAVADKTNPAFKAGGDLIVDGGQDIPAPDVTGLYKIVIDFITGKYTVTAVTAPADIPPATLFIVGDATPGGWTNPVPVPSQQFTRKTNAGFEITLPLTAAKNYLLLPVNTNNWDHKYAVVDKTKPEAREAGTLVVDGGQDFPSPAVDGNYKIEVEFVTKTYKVTKL
jgi:hypothetical protein